MLPPASHVDPHEPLHEEPTRCMSTTNYAPEDAARVHTLHLLANMAVWQYANGVCRFLALTNMAFVQLCQKHMMIAQHVCEKTCLDTDSQKTHHYISNSVLLHGSYFTLTWFFFMFFERSRKRRNIYHILSSIFIIIIL